MQAAACDLWGAARQPQRLRRIRDVVCALSYLVEWSRRAPHMSSFVGMECLAPLSIAPWVLQAMSEEKVGSGLRQIFAANGLALGVSNDGGKRGGARPAWEVRTSIL